MTEMTVDPGPLFDAVTEGELAARMNFGGVTINCVDPEADER